MRRQCYYLMDFDQQMILDATRGSIARFVNHSCEPNCRMIKWTVNGKPRMALFAGDKGIMTGEELTYDYNFDPYSVKNVQECRCGSPNCRGFLGPKPKEIKDALKPITTGKRKFQEMVEGAVQTVAAKKRKIAVPTSVKSVLATAKATTSQGLEKAKAVVDAATGNDRLVKKASEKSLRGWKGWVLVDEEGNEVVDQKTMVKYERRRSSTGTSATKRMKNENTNGQKTPKSKDVERPVSRRESVKMKAGSVRKNVVRTVRRSSKVGNGKTIRVIGHEEDQGTSE